MIYEYSPPEEKEEILLHEHQKEKLRQGDERKMQVFFILWNLNVDSFFFCLPWGG
jgi:hypothetical protein